jgi:hypothetical protein
LHGLLLYVVLYVGLTDMTQIFYWGNGRAFAAVAGAIALALLLYRARDQHDQL